MKKYILITIALKLLVSAAIVQAYNFDNHSPSIDDSNHIVRLSVDSNNNSMLKASTLPNNNHILNSHTDDKNNSNRYAYNNYSYDNNSYNNNSYYGEISKKTGQPKTVIINSYRRKNGTIVKKHYRSKPSLK